MFGKERFTCPRRAAEGHASDDSPLRMDGSGKDHWRTEGRVRTCSYDGSVHPDDFMDYVRMGAEVGTTDKGYKFYLPEFDGDVRGAGKFYTHHLSTEQSEEFAYLDLSRLVNYGAFPPYVRLYLPGLTTEKVEEIFARVMGEKEQ